MMYFLINLYKVLYQFRGFCHQFVTILQRLGYQLVYIYYFKKIRTPANVVFTGVLAERERFELSERVSVHTISSRAP